MNEIAQNDTMADVFANRPRQSQEADHADKTVGNEKTETDPQDMGQSPADDDGWSTIPINSRKAQDAILEAHFLKAKARLDAGASLSAIRKHYATKGLTLSPNTFKKRWDARVMQAQKQ